MNDLKAVYVVWEDPSSIDEWTDIEGVDTKLSCIHSFGILVKENNRCIVLSLNVDQAEKTASCSMIIPKCNILEMRQGTLNMVDVNGEETND